MTLAHRRSRGVHRTLSLFRTAPFRRYIIGIAISDTGTWMQTMAQAWVMTSLTNQAVMFGIVNFAAGIPMLVVTLLGGVASDRFDKRKVLAMTQIAQVIVSVVLGCLVRTGHIRLWHIIGAMILLGVCTAFQLPVIAALVPELVKREQIPTAIALDRTVFYGCRFVGPFVGGVLVERWGAASPFFVNAFSFVALIVALMSLPPPASKPSFQEHVSIHEGFRYLVRDRTMIFLTVLIALTTLFVVPVVYVLLPLYVRDILGFGPREMGWIMATAGIGAIIGSFGLLMLEPRRRLNALYVNVVAAVLAIFMMSRTRSCLVTAVSIGMLAIVLSVIFGLSNIIVQERTPNDLRGRVSAVFGLSFFALAPFAGLILTSASDLTGMRVALISASGVYGVLALGTLMISGQAVCDRPLSPALGSEFVPGD